MLLVLWLVWWVLIKMLFFLPGNHKLTATAKVIVKICEHEVSTVKYIISCAKFSASFLTPVILQMNEIEVCPECYLSACQKRDNWFCEPCVSAIHQAEWCGILDIPSSYTNKCKLTICSWNICASTEQPSPTSMGQAEGVSVLAC